MKKILTIFLLFIYTGSAFGIAVDYHYCSGHLTHVTILNFGAQGGCKCNAAAMPKDCCKDKLIYMKGDEHKSSAISLFVLRHNIETPIPVAYDSLSLHTSFFITANFIPDFVKQESSPPIFLLNNVFRI